VYPEFVGSSFADICFSGECDRKYYCVAPILSPDFKSEAAFWVTCESDRYGAPCTSYSFNDSDCYQNWKQPWNTGFIVGKDSFANYKNSIRDGLQRWGFNNTPLENTVPVVWVSDPTKEANIFLGLGIFGVVAAPILYLIIAILFTCFCRNRISRSL